MKPPYTETDHCSLQVLPIQLPLALPGLSQHLQSDTFIYIY